MQKQLIDYIIIKIFLELSNPQTHNKWYVSTMSTASKSADFGAFDVLLSS